MEARAAHCKKEVARYTVRAKRAESKIERTKNSQDSVIVTNAAAIPPDLKRYELKVDGSLWMQVFLALPGELASSL